MKLRYALLPLLFTFHALRAQHITGATYSPTPITECQFLTITLHGNLGMNETLDTFVPTVSGDTIHVTVNASGNGGAVSNFTQALPQGGPYPAGTYTCVYRLVLNGVLVLTYINTLVVGPAAEPNPGIFTEDSVCNSGPSVSLLSLMQGNPDAGGQWLDPNNTVVTNGMFVPGTSPEGFYSYQFVLQPPCTTQAQTLAISYRPNSHPGTNGTLTACAGPAPAMSLIAHLGGTPDAGGTWTHNGQPHGANYVPGTDGTGVFTYTVPGIPPCPATHATVTVTTAPAPHAGADATATVCADDQSILLSSYITGGQTTGTWYDPQGFTLGGTSTTISALAYPAGVYHYVVLGGVACPNDTASLTLTYQPLPCNIGIAENSGAITRLELVPNPTHDQVMLEMEFIRPFYRGYVELLDPSGRSALAVPLRGGGTSVRQTIDVSALRQGVYVARVFTNEGTALRRLMLR